VWKLRREPAGRASILAQQIFERCATRNLHLALVQLPQYWFTSRGELSQNHAEHVTCLRSVLMKPEHEAWLGRIWEAYTAASTEVLK
jgi:hypothetical protein